MSRLPIPLLPLPTLLATLLALPLAAPAAAPPPAPATDKIVTLEKFVVEVPRFRWTHAQTPRFEILSNLEETKFVASVVAQAGQIISLFEDTSPLFSPQLDLPAKIIFIQDEIVERLFSQANIGSTIDDYRERMAGAPFHKDTSQFKNDYKISAFANHNDEQLVIVKFLTKAYMSGRQMQTTRYLPVEKPEREKILECAADLAVTYLTECARIHAGGQKIPWLDAALNALRGHVFGGTFALPRGYSSPVYGKGAYSRTGWINIRGTTITLGRYCLACELDALQTAADFPRFDITKRKELWAQFMAAPDTISLGDIFNDSYAPLPKTVDTLQQQLLMQREVHDFLYYCLLGPDDAARDAFTNLVLATATTTIDESAFQKLFNATYAEFQAKMYDYYQQLAWGKAKDPFSVATDAIPNPWGKTGLTITLPPGALSTTPVKLKPARRPDISRLLADWFDTIGAGASARASLLKAYAESPEAARDPQFLATLALNEARYGNRLYAMTLLEKTAAAGITRPTVYRALARLRLDDIIASKGPDYRLNPAEFTSVLSPLNTAFAQPRPNPQNYILYAALCEHTDIKTPEAYANRVAEACKKFPADIDMLETILPPFAKDAHKPEALQLARALAQTTPLPPDKKHRLDTLIQKLETEK